MTNQELFEKAVRGLASQNWEKAVDDYGYCMYYMPDGRRCGIGWAVDEETAKKWQRGNDDNTSTLSAGRLVETGELEADRDFANELQAAHDDCYWFLEGAMWEFGEEHGLTWPEGV